MDYFSNGAMHTYSTIPYNARQLALNIIAITCTVGGVEPREASLAFHQSLQSRTSFSFTLLFTNASNPLSSEG